MVSGNGMFRQHQVHALLEHHLARERQTYARTTPFGGKEWSEYLLRHIGGYGGAIIADT